MLHYLYNNTTVRYLPVNTSTHNLVSYSLQALSNGFFRSPFTPRRSPFRKESSGNIRMLLMFCIWNIKQEHVQFLNLHCIVAKWVLIRICILPSHGSRWNHENIFFKIYTSLKGNFTHITTILLSCCYSSPLLWLSHYCLLQSW